MSRISVLLGGTIKVPWRYGEFTSVMTGDADVHPVREISSISQSNSSAGILRVAVVILDGYSREDDVGTRLHAQSQDNYVIEIVQRQGVRITVNKCDASHN